MEGLIDDAFEEVMMQAGPDLYDFILPNNYYTLREDGSYVDDHMLNLIRFQ